MQVFLQIVMVLLSVFFAWRTFKALKNQPGLLSKENVSKSFGTMGLLGLVLIVFVTLMVWMVRS